MTWIDKIQEAIDYIESNLTESELSSELIGKEINYAPSSFMNLFSAVTGYSVGEYIRFRRLSEAADELLNNDISVTGAAFKYGYETSEAFSKAFRKMYGCSPSQISKSDSKYQKFSPLSIQFGLKGGFNMKRNLIPNLLKVDWSDTQRQNEFVNSVVSALNAVGENLNYDYVCAVSGSAFRTSFSMKSAGEWNHGNYHAVHTPIIIEHTFRMLGYKVKHYVPSQGHRSDDYEYDRQLITDSIDRGIPVITLEGVINCSDACVISGYDNNGDVLLGYNPFMYISDDHNEAHDDTGYFRKSAWHDRSNVRILIIEGKCEKLSKEEIFTETVNLAKRLIKEENLAPGQHNGLAAHKAFADALMTYTWNDNFEPYLNVMCNYKQYLDRQYAVKFFEDNGNDELAGIYRQITDLSKQLGQIIPQDFSAGDMFGEKERLKPFCDVLMEIYKLEEKVINCK